MFEVFKAFKGNGSGWSVVDSLQVFNDLFSIFLFKKLDNILKLMEPAALMLDFRVNDSQESDLKKVFGHRFSKFVDIEPKSALFVS